MRISKVIRVEAEVVMGRQKRVVKRMSGWHGNRKDRNGKEGATGALRKA